MFVLVVNAILYKVGFLFYIYLYYEECIFKPQVLLKMMEHCLFYIYIKNFETVKDGAS